MKRGIEPIDISTICGFKIGHAQDLNAATGCTVIFCEEGAAAGVDVRGGSPGTRETDALNPLKQCSSIHAVLLAGGSAFGLDAAAGIMQYLEGKGVGRDVQVTKVPIVCGAILFDLLCGDFKVRPDKAMGFAACLDAEKGMPRQGTIGAGTGALVGKVRGCDYAMKGGLGLCAFQAGDLQVGAVIAVNCVGDVFDPEEGKIIAGVLNSDKKTLGSTEEAMLSNYFENRDFFSGKISESNTVIGAVLTNAELTKVQANNLAAVSHNGIARTIRPAHSSYDGDTLFSMASGKVAASFDAVGILAVRAVEGAIVNAIKNAGSLCGFPSCSDISASR